MSENMGLVVGKGWCSSGKSAKGKTISGSIGAIGGMGIGAAIGSAICSAGTRAGAGSMVVGVFKVLGSLTPLKSIGW